MNKYEAHYFKYQIALFYFLVISPLFHSSY